MNEIVKSQSSIQTKVNYNVRTKKRNWELSYGNKDKIYLTQQEKEEFLKAILSGKDVIALNGLVLTRFFKYLIPTVREDDLTIINKDNKYNIYNKEKKEKKENTSPPEIELFLLRWNELFGSRYRVNTKRIIMLRERRKTYSLEDILLAVKNLSGSSFHKGDNNSGWVADPDFLLRNDSQIDKFINLKVKKEEYIKL